MTETSTRPRHSGHLVTAVLVCHDGAQWLPEVLDALAAQTRQPERFVVVDTGSADESAAIVVDLVGAETLVSQPATTSFGAAIHAGLDAFVASPPLSRDLDGDAAVEWVWLLHDDAVPDRAALEQLLLRVEDSPSVWMVGPKARAWDGARLLEAGLTIDPTGHVDTGVDGVELDQGQRDDVDEVLAVGTAGALVRRDVWDRLGGLDPAWSTYAGDVDFGWRINAAGGRVVVAPDAVIRHARAQTVGRRPHAVRHGSPAVYRRRSGMQVVLSNTSPMLVVPLLLRYLVGGILRSIGLLVIARRPPQALNELLAVVGVFAHPLLVVTGRRERSKSRKVSHFEMRHLFPNAARRWHSSPFRVSQFRSERAREVQRSSGSESGPVSDDAESMSLDESIVGRFFRQPSTVLFLAMSLLALVAERHVMGSVLHGGRLLPAPNGASDLWSTYTATWHPASVGSAAPAPPYLAILAVLSTIAFGKVWLVVDVIFLGAVPLSALSAYTAARGLTSAVRVRIWAAIAYSLLPAVTGAVAGGRIDVVVVAILLPQVIRVGASALRGDPGSRTWRRSIGAGLLLAVVCAFGPLLWLMAVVGLAVGIGFAEREADAMELLVRRVAAAAVMLAVAVVALMPWSWHVIAHPHLLLAGAGLPEFLTSHGAPGLSLALLRAGGPAQPPVWIGIPIVAAAMLGLTRQSRVAIARVGAAMLLLGVAIAVGITRSAGVTAGVSGSRHWPGLVLLVAGAGALLAALVAAVGARPALRQQDFSWRQPAAVAIVALAIVSMFALAGGWLIRGAGRPLNDSALRALPLFTQSELAVPTTPRALVLSSDGATISFALARRPAGPQLGDADVAPAPNTVAGRHLATAVQDLVAGRPGAGAELVPFGVTYVVVPSPSVARLRSALGRATTLTVHPAGGATVWESSMPTGELTVLSPLAAPTALAGRVPAEAVAHVLAATPGSANTMLTLGVAPGLLVLNEPASHNWHATVNGKALTPRTAYGWAQAFELPNGTGRLKITFDSGSRHVWLIAELVLVVAGLISIVPVRRGDDEATA
jgi:GT2 family glycosyltransferase